MSPLVDGDAREARTRVGAGSSAALVVMLTAACASYGPGSLMPGQPIEEATRSMGVPTARYALPGGGSRVEFARGPFGKHTYMVDVDPGGRVRTWTQVLTEANFDALKPGTAVQDLLVTLGTPSHRRGGGWQGGEVWSWRYQATFCQWFQASVIEGKVRDTSYGPDPLCDDTRDDKVSNRR